VTKDEAQRRRWTFYEAVNLQQHEKTQPVPPDGVELRDEANGKKWALVK
jgi:hypothetical protein